MSKPSDKLSDKPSDKPSDNLSNEYTQRCSGIYDNGVKCKAKTEHSSGLCSFCRGRCKLKCSQCSKYNAEIGKYCALCYILWSRGEDKEFSDVMMKLGIYNKKDFMTWVVHNHPDKGGSTEKFVEMYEFAKNKFNF